MQAALPGDGAVLPLQRTLSSLAPDPLDLYTRLGSGPDTFLLETVDIRTRQAEQSFLSARCAIRLEARGELATFTALSPQGHTALHAIAARVSGIPEYDPENGCLRVRFPAPPLDSSSEAERMQAPSTLDALRALIWGWTVLSPPVLPALLTAGIFAYDLIERFEQLPPNATDPLDFPDFVFWLPEELIVINHRTLSTTVFTLVFGGDGAHAAYHDAVSRMDALSQTIEACTPRELQTTPPTTRIAHPDKFAVDTSEADFATLVSTLKDHIVKGDVFQIVPSRTFSTPCPDPLAAYARLRQLNPSPYMFYLHGKEHTVFGASPETAVKVSGRPRTVEIRPIAGTAARGLDGEGHIDLDLDSRLEVELRLSEKELAEHMMLIDLARNDIARVSKPGTRYVPRLLTVDHYSHVMHLVSYVSGELREDLDALHAYAATMNMGTLVGAPKIKAAELLRHHETTRRGPYGGGVGYITSDGDIDTAIIIRSAVVRDGIAYVRAGAGVVHDSEPVAEATETWRKAQAVLKALESGA